MELLLKLCTWRNLALAAAAVAVIYSAGRLQGYPRRWYRDWRYPPQGQAGAGGEEIMRLKDERDSSELVRRHDRVLALLAQAEAEGFDVSALRRKADATLSLNSARTRRKAVLLLAEVELAVPHKKVKYAPLYPATEEEEAVPEDVPGRGEGQPHALVKGRR
ncbi:MAG: hypothetical protein NTY77_04450 [Elusimicrobia bacterium]|nr:hypothetical protein [Elusimicrobiota bacterium]